MFLEIIKHDGPARLGKLHFQGSSIPTPTLFWTSAAGKAPSNYFGISSSRDKRDEQTIISYGTIFSKERIKGFGILPSFPSGYNAPVDIAELSVAETIGFSDSYPDFGAVIEGGRYVDLRKKCALKFRERPILKIADSNRLIKNQRRLVEVLTMVRETASPNTAVYMPDITPHMFPLLAYIGVDVFDLKPAVLGAHENKYLTPTGVNNLSDLSELPCPCRECESSNPRSLDFEGLLYHNVNTTVASIREVRGAIKMGLLRNLVEERATVDSVAMGALRILDLEKGDFLERYTPIY